MTPSMPGPDARHIDTPPPTTARARMAERLYELLGIPIELFDGVPGEPTGPARDLLDVEPHLAHRARALMDHVMFGRDGLDTIHLVVSTPGLTTDDMDRAA